MKKVPEICRRAAELVQEKYDPEAIILYGSYAAGCWNADSDMDLLCLVKEPDPPNPFPELRRLTMSRLSLSGEALEEEIHGVKISVMKRSIRCLNLSYRLDPFHLTTFSGKVLRQKNGTGDIYLKRVNEAVRDWLPLPGRAKEEAKEQIQADLHAIANGGKLREHLAKFFLLESFSLLYILCDALPVGAKMMLRYLKRDAPEAYAIVEKALRPDADAEDITVWGRYMLSTPIRINFMDADFSCFGEGAEGISGREE